LIPYYRPGDLALGEAIRGLAGKHSAVLLANHGPVVSANSLEAAVYAIEELEETAKLFLLLRNAPTRPLNSEQIQELKEVFQLDLWGPLFEAAPSESFLSMPKFAANLTMMFNEVPFPARFAAASRAGFKGVEFLFPYDYAPQEVG
jgi:Class II Aldolase and Adducin N-terminal domain